MGMAEDVSNLAEARREKTLAQFRALLKDSSNVVWSAHFYDRQAEKVPHLTNRHFMNALRNGEIIRVGPGKYSHWKVEIKHISAGEEFCVACDVGEDKLILVTCWGGGYDAEIE